MWDLHTKYPTIHSCSKAKCYGDMCISCYKKATPHLKTAGACPFACCSGKMSLVTALGGEELAKVKKFIEEDPGPVDLPTEVPGGSKAVVQESSGRTIRIWGDSFDKEVRHFFSASICLKIVFAVLSILPITTA